MPRILLTVLLALPMMAGPAFPGGDGAHDLSEVQEVTYRCSDGAAVHLTYLFERDRAAMAVMGFRGQQVAMRQSRSGSGLRFVALDTEAGLRWHVKGAEGLVLFLAADHSAKEQILVHDCREARGHLYHVQR